MLVTLGDSDTANSISSCTAYIWLKKADREEKWKRKLIIFLGFSDPPGPPMINVVPSTFSLEINWNSSVQDINNIQILDYKIKVIDGTTHKEVAHHTAVTRARLLVKHLVRNRTYTVEVQARNEVGYGATANISAKTLLAGKLNHGIKILLALPLISPPSYRPIYL